MPALFHTDAVQEHIFPLPEEIRTLKVTKINWPLEKDISLHLFKKKKSFFHLISRLQHQHFKEKNIFISHSFFLCNCVHQNYLINYWSMFLSPPCFAKVGRVGCFGKPVSTQEKESRICIPKSVLNSTSVSHTLLSPLNVRRNTQFY